MPKFKVFKCMYLVHKKTPAPKSSPMHFHEHALFCGFFCGPIVPHFLLESRPLKINRLTSGEINTPTGHTTASNGKIKCLSRACSSTENVSGAWLTGSCSDAGISFCLKFRDKLDYLGVTEFSCKARRQKRIRTREYISKDKRIHPFFQLDRRPCQGLHPVT